MRDADRLEDALRALAPIVCRGPVGKVMVLTVLGWFAPGWFQPAWLDSLQATAVDEAR